MLSPFPVVSVCSNGQLNLTCTTNLSMNILEWNITVYQSGMSFNRAQLVSSISQLAKPLTVNMIAFNITRSSPDNLYPLMSSVYVTNVTHVLNQTKIRCTEIGMTSSTTSSMVTTVNVIMPDFGMFIYYIQKKNLAVLLL